jgi:hypothetical protein
MSGSLTPSDNFTFMTNLDLVQKCTYSSQGHVRGPSIGGKNVVRCSQGIIGRSRILLQKAFDVFT